ncbi:MAG: hypothetical protein WC889_11050 [Myxococcota bacterium]
MRQLRYLEPSSTSQYDISFADGWDSILPGLEDDRLFLDTYPDEKLLERFEHYGIMRGVRRAGIKSVTLKLNTSDPGFQNLEIFSKDPPLDDPIAEVTLHKGMFSTKAGFAEKLYGEVIPMVFIQWIRLQNPLRQFTAKRPQLPGQKFPGLGVGDRVMIMLSALGEKMKTEGLANTPEYPHNAVLYSQKFMYLNPETQGRLTALKRDLGKYALADGSWGIMLGCVREVRSGETFQWFKEEQILPIGPRLRYYFGSRAYKVAASTAASSVSYELDAGKLASLPRVLTTAAPADIVVGDPGDEEDAAATPPQTRP